MLGVSRVILWHLLLPPPPRRQNPMRFGERGSPTQGDLERALRNKEIYYVTGEILLIHEVQNGHSDRRLSRQIPDRSGPSRESTCRPRPVSAGDVPAAPYALGCGAVSSRLACRDSCREVLVSFSILQRLSLVSVHARVACVSVGVSGCLLFFNILHGEK